MSGNNQTKIQSAGARGVYPELCKSVAGAGPGSTPAEPEKGFSCAL
jgi:hypothetical protein